MPQTSGGVHIRTGPIHVHRAQPGDIPEVEILDLRPRPSANPAFAGKALVSNASTWRGYQYDDPFVPKHEAMTIYEIDLAGPGVARAHHSYRRVPRAESLRA